MSDKFIKDYVYYIKLHEGQRLSFNEREKFWITYWEENNED